MKTTLSKVFGVLFLLLIATGFYNIYSVNQSATTNSSQPIAGSFSVNSTGDASWSMNIQVPPGIQGVQPNLCLEYTSGMSNSLYGMGFDLKGMSSINRVGATLAQDGFKGEVAYADDDRFALNGYRLMLNSNGTYGANGTVYHTQKETWTKIVAVGTAGSGPQSFQVWLKNGHYLEYGNTPDSRVEAVGLTGSNQGSIREWLLNKYVDLNGNTITVSYTQTPPDVSNAPLTSCSGQGQNYPLRIDYTSNEGVAAMRSVQFIYEERPDKIPVFAGGGKYSTNARVSQIQTWVKNTMTDSSLVRTVSLNYQSNTPLNVSRIEQISVCGGGDCYTPTTFTWTNPANKLVATSVDGPKSMENNGRVGDFNGDGLTDILSVEEEKIYTATATGFDTGTPYGLSLDEGSYFIGDYNGDGISDIYVDAGSGLNGSVYYMENGSFQAPSNSISLYIDSGCDDCVWLGDYNGDGLTDIASSNARTCYISFGTTDQSVGLEPSVEIANMDINKGGSKTFPADFDGDGLTDLLNCSSTSGYLTLSNFSKSNGFKTPILISDLNLSLSSNYTWIGDYNCDGLADILAYGADYKFRLYHANGVGFEEGDIMSNINISNPEFWPGDYNNDCFLDFYANYPGGGKVFYFNGQNFETQVSTDFNFESSNTWLGDFNGDGLPDLFNSDGGTASYGSNSQNSVANNNQIGNYISEINNGIGSSIVIQYKPITDTSIYTAGNDTTVSGIEGLRMLHQFNPVPLAPIQNPSNVIVPIQDAQYVVNNWTENDGRGNSYSIYQKYSGAKFDYSGYGFLGFDFKTTIDSQMNSISQQFYYQDFPLTGLSDSTYTASLTGELLQATSTKWLAESITTNGNSTLWDVSQTEDNHYDYEDGQKTNQQQVQNWFDDYGNPQLTKIVGDVSNPANTLWVQNSYDNDEDNWQLGYMTAVQQSADKEGLSPLTSRKIQYDLSNRNVDTVLTWFSQDDSWLVNTYAYDQFGNITSSTNFNGDSTRMVYDDQYHTFITQNISTPNAQGNRLISTSVYEPYYGNEIQATDPNGNNFYKSYDGLGRFNNYQIPSSTGTPFTAYQKQIISNDIGYIIQQIGVRDWDGMVLDTILTYYDGLSRKYKTQYRGWNNQWVFATRAFNADNQVVSKSLPYFEGDKISRVYHQYDPIGRLLRKSVPFGKNDSLVTTFDYQPMKVLVNEAVGTPNASTSSFCYSYFNGTYRPTSYTNADQKTTNFNWDILGRILKGADPLGVETSASWNSLSENEWYYSPSFDTTHFRYFPVANQTQKINALGDTLTSTYDNLGRLLYLADGLDTLESYRYDLSNYTNGLGNLCEVIQNNGPTQYSYQYDPIGNITETNVTMDGNSWQKTIAFNPDMSINYQLLPDGSRLDYSYTHFAAPVAISATDSKGKTENIFQLSESNALKQFNMFSYGNGTSIRSDFDLGGLPNWLNVQASDKQTLVARSYNWTHNVRIDNIADSLNNILSQQFDYSSTGRLVGVNHSSGRDSLAYDHSGNLIWNDSIAFDYEDHQVQSGTNGGNTIYTVVYDACGNMLERNVTIDGISINYRYTYNAQLQMDSVFRNDSLAYTYGYDFKGERNLKHNHVEGVRTYYVDGNFTVRKAGNENSASVIIGLKNQVMASYVNSVDNIRYYHWNQNGSTILTTDNEGDALTSLSYDPYGKSISLEHDLINYSFNGKEYDPYSGLYYFSFRYYDPITGRFAAPDNQLGAGLLTADAFNNYAFCLNNPISFSDPTGHSKREALEVTAAVVIDLTADVIDLSTEGTGEVVTKPITKKLNEAVLVDLAEDEPKKAPIKPKKKLKRGRSSEPSFLDEPPAKAKRESIVPDRLGVNKDWTEEDYKQFKIDIDNFDDSTINDPDDPDFDIKKTVVKAPRPGFRKGVVETVWRNSHKMKDGKLRVICPTSGKELSWHPDNRRRGLHGEWDMGHKEGFEYRHLYKAYKNNEISWRQVIDIYNDPSHYQAEDPSANRGHTGESKKSLYKLPAFQMKINYVTPLPATWLPRSPWRRPRRVVIRIVKDIS